MKYCTSCGNPLDDSAKFCTVCGAPVEVQQAENQSAEQPDGAQKSDVKEKIENAVNNFTNTPNTSADYAYDDIEKNKLMAVLAYIGLLVLIPLFAAKESPFARYHTNQGLLLLIFHFVGNVCGVIPLIGGVVAAIANLLWLVLLVLGIINAVKGEAKELPLIGKYRILK